MLCRGTTTNAVSRYYSGLFTAMHQSEAMWIFFKNRDSLINNPPVAVRVFVGGINTITGSVDVVPGFGRYINVRDGDTEKEGDQDYVTVPPQRWLDGFAASDSTVRLVRSNPAFGPSNSLLGLLVGNSSRRNWTPMRLSNPRSETPTSLGGSNSSSLRPSNVTSKLSIATADSIGWAHHKTQVSVLAIESGSRDTMKSASPTSNVERFGTCSTI